MSSRLLAQAPSGLLPASSASMDVWGPHLEPRHSPWAGSPPRGSTPCSALSDASSHFLLCLSLPFSSFFLLRSLFLSLLLCSLFPT